SLAAPEQSVEVELLPAEDESDVTLNTAVAAVRPFTPRLVRPSDRRCVAGVSRACAAFLRPRAWPRRRRLATHVPVRPITAEGRMALSEVAGGTHYRATLLVRIWDSWQYRRVARRNPPPERLVTPRERLAMLPQAVEQMLIFYRRSG